MIAISNVQKALNIFTNKYLEGVTPLVVDGKKGQATNKRVKQCKYWLGYQGKVSESADVAFRSRLWHPKSLKYSTPVRIAKGSYRRSKSRAAWKRNTKSLINKTGWTQMDGHQVADWIAAQLLWARNIGYNNKTWTGFVISGGRTPEYSESLCIALCGNKSCPGICAGRSSNHNGNKPGEGAVDLSKYEEFDELITHCPEEITNGHRLRNDLPNDRPHHSVSGH